MAGSWEPLSCLKEFAAIRQLLIHYRRPAVLIGAVNWYRALRRKRETESWRVKVPTLMLWGGRNGYLDKGAAEASLALCDNGKIIWIENGTHLVHLEEPETVNKALLDFLKT